MLDVVKEGLESKRGRWREVAADAGVSYRTLQKIAQGVIEDPGVSHVQRLYDYFRAQDTEQRVA